MNQQKIGKLLRQLRKEKGLTQQQLAEILNISDRSVSRWENGNNLPDLDLLIELADFYEIEIRELLDGERKQKKQEMRKEDTMDQNNSSVSTSPEPVQLSRPDTANVETTVLKAAEYTSSQMQAQLRNIRRVLLAGIVCWCASQLIEQTDLSSHRSLCLLAQFLSGAGAGIMLGVLLMLSRCGSRLRAFKKRLLKKAA